MTQLLLPLLGLVAALLAALVVLIARRGAAGAAETAEIRRQLAELRGHLDASGSGMHQRLADTGHAVAEVRERLGQLAEATRRLEALGGSVADVRQLLQVPRLRGTLGEIWLEELLRQVFPDGLYETQYAFRSAERVDAVLRLGTRLVPIDAKFPLEACQRMLDADGAGDHSTAERERRVFRRSLRARIDEIADKYIRPEEGTFDFALMYIPAERVYYEAVVRGEALEGGESVLAYAMSRKVVPVSPHTFYAYLSAVLHGLKGLEVEERARELRGEIAALDRRFERFWTAFDKVGAHLGNAQKQFAESEREAGRIREHVRGLTATASNPDTDPDPPVAVIPRERSDRGISAGMA